MVIDCILFFPALKILPEYKRTESEGKEKSLNARDITLVIWQVCTKLRGFSPRANHTDRVLQNLNCTWWDSLSTQQKRKWHFWNLKNFNKNQFISQTDLIWVTVFLQQQYCHYPDEKLVQSFRGTLPSFSSSGRRHDTPMGPFSL